MTIGGQGGQGGRQGRGGFGQANPDAEVLQSGNTAFPCCLR